jgi:outer membrane protein TolC
MRRVLIWTTTLALAGGTPLFAQHEHAPQGATTTLASLVAEAEGRNSQVSSAEHAWQAATHVAPQLTPLPDPQLTVQEFSVGSPKPFAGFSNSDFAYVGFGVSQDLPYPGKLRLRGVAAERGADTKKAQIEVVRTSVADQVKTIYLRLAYIRQSMELLERNRAALDLLIQTETSRYSVGQGSQADILRGQLERTKLLREMTMHQQEAGQLEAALKALLHRPQESPDIEPEALQATAVLRPLEELAALVHSQNPALQADRAMVAEQDAHLSSVKREAKPDFNVGYMFQQTGAGYRDYYVATFNVRLPRRKRVDAEIAEAAETLERSRSDADADLQQQIAEVKKEAIATESAAELMDEYQQGLIPQAESVYQSELTAYQSDREKLGPVLGALIDRITFEHDYQQALLDHETALAHLETLTGAELR